MSSLPVDSVIANVELFWVRKCRRANALDYYSSCFAGRGAIRADRIASVFLNVEDDAAGSRSSAPAIQRSAVTQTSRLELSGSQHPTRPSPTPTGIRECVISQSIKQGWTRYDAINRTSAQKLSRLYTHGTKQKKTSDANRRKPRSPPHCRVLPPGVCNNRIQEPPPVCSEAFMTAAVTVYS